MEHYDDIHIDWSNREHTAYCTKCKGQFNTKNMVFLDADEYSDYYMCIDCDKKETQNEELNN